MQAHTILDYVNEPEDETSQWIIPSLISTSGTVALVGPGKEGKSFLALQLAREISQGGHFLGRPCSQTKVLYLYLDSGEKTFKERVRDRLELGWTIPQPEYLWFVKQSDLPRTGLDIKDTSQMNELRELIEREDFGFIVIDVLVKLHTENEIDVQSMKRVFGVINYIAYGRSVFIIHHTPKITKDYEFYSPSQAGRGTAYLGGEVDCTWLLAFHKLHIQGRYDEDLLYRVERDELGFFAFPQAIHEQRMVDKLLALCEVHHDMTHKAIWETYVKDQLGLTRATYYRRLKGLECAHEQKKHPSVYATVESHTANTAEPSNLSTHSPEQSPSTSIPQDTAQRPSAVEDQGV